jgi:hypothetical protein
MLDQHWSTESLTSRYDELIPVQERLEDETPFSQARPISVDIPVNDTGKANNYTDNMVPICLDIGSNAELCTDFAAISFDVLGRHLEGFEPIAREVLLSLSKLLGEGRLQEVKTVLGWNLENFRLLVCLPSDKFGVWSADIESHISKWSILTAELKTLVGRLEHVGYLLPLVHHFLGWIRWLKDVIVSCGVRHVRLSAHFIADLRLLL